MDIADYLRQNPRHKLIFTRNELPGFSFVDIGHEMSRGLEGQTHPSVVAPAVFDSVSKTALQEHPSFGRYTAFKNIGILFEPELRLNIRMLFESIAKDTLLIVCTDGCIKNETYYFDDSTEEYRIPLHGLSYLEIEQNIPYEI